MAARSLVASVLLAGALVTAIGCKDAGDAQKPAIESGPVPTNYGFINAVKDATFPVYPSVTIGKAFDSYKYLQNKEWSVEPLQSKQFSITYSGWFEPRTLDEQAVRAGVAARGIEVRFLMDPNGSFSVAGISVIEKRSDGSLYRPRTLDIGSTLEKIYANKKIEL